MGWVSTVVKVVDGLRSKRGESGITPQSFWTELLWGPWWYLRKDWEGLGEVWASLLLLFSHLVVSDYLPPHGLQHARLPCPSPSPGACSNSRPFSQWCNPAISSSVIPFFSRLQSFPASGSFQMSRLFTSGGQSVGVSASASVLPKNIQDWFPLGWTGLISLRVQGLSRVSSNTTVQKRQFFGALRSLECQVNHTAGVGETSNWLQHLPKRSGGDGDVREPLNITCCYNAVSVIK